MEGPAGMRRSGSLNHPLVGVTLFACKLSMKQNSFSILLGVHVCSHKRRVLDKIDAEKEKKNTSEGWQSETV